MTYSLMEMSTKPFAIDNSHSQCSSRGPKQAWQGYGTRVRFLPWAQDIGYTDFKHGMSLCRLRYMVKQLDPFASHIGVHPVVEILNGNPMSFFDGVFNAMRRATLSTVDNQML